MLEGKKVAISAGGGEGEGDDRLRVGVVAVGFGTSLAFGCSIFGGVDAEKLEDESESKYSESELDDEDDR